MEKLPHLKERDKGKSRDKVAEKLGVSGKQYDKIKTVRDKAPKDIERQWKQGKISTHHSYLKTIYLIWRGRQFGGGKFLFKNSYN